ncbi:hypothetical protein E2C01_088909 [Portunus trituberculatus]|uniref:Uncharacterized protein n=1 Tax=Portunus trituberculatus TaxID=210409 RepID=A0A5B7JL40_PORTR|nr:hypothetical protein [Portunus trituberculatus]
MGAWRLCPPAPWRYPSRPQLKPRGDEKVCSVGGAVGARAVWAGDCHMEGEGVEGCTSCVE